MAKYNNNKNIKSIFEEEAKTKKKLRKEVKQYKESEVWELPLKNEHVLSEKAASEFKNILRNLETRFTFRNWTPEQTKDVVLEPNEFIERIKAVNNGAVQNREKPLPFGVGLMKIIYGMQSLVDNDSQLIVAPEYTRTFAESAMNTLKIILPVEVVRTGDATRDYVNTIKLLIAITVTDMKFADTDDFFLRYCNDVSWFFNCIGLHYDRFGNEFDPTLFILKALSGEFDVDGNPVDYETSAEGPVLVDKYIVTSTNQFLSRQYGAWASSNPTELNSDFENYVKKMELQTTIGIILSVTAMTMTKLGFSSFDNAFLTYRQTIKEKFYKCKSEADQILSDNQEKLDQATEEYKKIIDEKEHHIKAYQKAFLKCGLPDVKAPSEKDEENEKDVPSNESITMLENTIAECERQNSKLAEKLQKAIEENRNLKNEMIMLLPEDEQKNIGPVEIDTKDIDYDAKYVFVLKTRQPLDLENSIRSAFKNAVIVNDTKGINQSADLVILLTKWMSHSLYTGAKRVCKDNKIPYMHCPNSNIDIIKEDIWRYYNS